MDRECTETKLLKVADSKPIGYYNAFKFYYLEALTASTFRVQVAWRDLVQNYTELSLSHAKDTLPALSGITQRFIGLRPGDRFLPGLWELSFVENLIWFAGGASKRSNLQARPVKWRAPT